MIIYKEKLIQAGFKLNEDNNTLSYTSPVTGKEVIVANEDIELKRLIKILTK